MSLVPVQHLGSGHGSGACRVQMHRQMYYFSTTNMGNIHMKTIQKGFTLIELMIVVAIIAILAAIALPQYQNYISRSQVSRVMGESGNLKTAVEYCVSNGRTAAIHSNIPAGTALPPTECSLDAAASTILTGAQQGSGAAPLAGTGYPQVVITAATGAATITSTFGNGANASLTTAGANELVWTRSVDGTWTCATTVEQKYRPTGCQ